MPRRYTPPSYTVWPSQGGQRFRPDLSCPRRQIHNQDTPVPGQGGPFGRNAITASFGLSRGNVVFARNVGGVDDVGTSGGTARVVADPTLFVWEPRGASGGFGNFFAPDLSGGTVALLPGTGMSAVYTAPLGGDASISVCQTDPQGQCLGPPGPAVALQIEDASGVTRGSTSVAIRTQ